MSTESINILVVEDNPDDVALIQEYVSAATRNQYALTRAGQLSKAISLAIAGRFDAILLDLALPDSVGLETLSRLRAAVPYTPIVVLSGTDDEATIEQSLQAGAQDYLVKGQFAGEVVTRTIRHAIERTKILASLDAQRQQKLDMLHEQQLLDDIAEAKPLTAPMSADGSVPRLAAAMPQYFELFVNRYEEELDLALECRAHGAGSGEDGQTISAMAQQLGALRASARDVLDIHMTAVKNKGAGTDVRKAEVYVEEGRFIVLRLLGHLVAYYRSHPFLTAASL